MKILVVDDQLSNRLITKFLAEAEGHTCIQAKDGQDAIEQFIAHSPDFVLMDIVMPVMDGYDAAQYIKNHAGDRHIPIIFLTGKHDEASLLKCLECGGDDYLIKPINGTLLKAKIRAHLRTLELTQQVKVKNEELTQVYENLAREHEMGRHVLSHTLERNLKNCPNIQQYMSSMSTFNGDVFLLAENPNGGLYIFLGDFTGHGLAAAIGTIPLSQKFFSMCEKGASIADIVSAMNQVLKTFLPDYMFCAATMIQLYERGDSAHIWSGGLPDAYVVRRGQGVVKTICSKNMPLGILNKDDFNDELAFYRFETGDRLFLFSDGILEGTDPEAGSFFGEKRLKQVLESNEENNFKALLDAYYCFVGDQHQQDDISVVEVLAQPYETKFIRDLNFNFDKETTFLPWEISVNIQSEEIKNINVVNNLISLLPSFIRVSCTIDILKTILSELYANALDHGLLKLSSEMKAVNNGFSEYYQLRDKRLDGLKKGFIKIQLATYLEDKKLKLKISFKDSGDGFDFFMYQTNDEVDIKPWGRGIFIVKSLCESVTYKDNGSAVDAVLLLN